MQQAAARLATAPRRITVLGSTGSVGCNTIDLIRRDPGAFEVEALTAYSNVKLLAEQARELGARCAVVGDAGKYFELKEALSGSGIEAAAGTTAVAEAGGRPAEWVMAAIVGAAGLEATLAAVRRGAGEQGDAGVRGFAHFGRDRPQWCHPAARRFRAQRDLPGIRLQARRGR
jgi:1-deoxy-D-xylulose-5-phosphate reductoisomerase